MDMPPPRTPRLLMAVVIVMGVLIVLGTAGLIGVIIHRAMSPAHKVMTVARQDVLRGEAARLALPGGGRLIAEAVRPDGSLALQISSPQGDRVVIWNPETNRIVAQVTLTP